MNVAAALYFMAVVTSVLCWDPFDYSPDDWKSAEEDRIERQMREQYLSKIYGNARSSGNKARSGSASKQQTGYGGYGGGYQGSYGYGGYAPYGGYNRGGQDGFGYGGYGPWGGYGGFGPQGGYNGYGGYGSYGNQGDYGSGRGRGGNNGAITNPGNPVQPTDNKNA